ncbi:MAG: hypothetical protein E7288_11250 [Lachnospiraceae bacterium]|nr:hypothetical protein [Lachnospiraceae bacterium]
MKKTLIVLGVLAISLFSFTGCNDDSELNKYKREVEDFYEELAERNDAINAINSDTQAASSELLDELDKVNVAFKEFAALEVPREYISVESLADEAATLMDEAVTQYHQAFAGETINDFDAAMAYEKYCRAIIRINYIGDLFQGKKLEGEGISVIYEESSEE